MYLLTVLGCALSGYILATAAYSPGMSITCHRNMAIFKFLSPRHDRGCDSGWNTGGADLGDHRSSVLLCQGVCGGHVS